MRKQITFSINRQVLLLSAHVTRYDRKCCVNFIKKAMLFNSQHLRNSDINQV